jgi:hypothetical protein
VYLVRPSKRRKLTGLARRLFKQDLASVTCGILQELESGFFSKMNLQVLVRFHKSHLLDCSVLLNFAKTSCYILLYLGKHESCLILQVLVRQFCSILPTKDLSSTCFFLKLSKMTCNV